MTDERKALYWLSTSGLPASKQNKLLGIYGSALELFDAFPSEKLSEFVGNAESRMSKSHDEEFLDRELKNIAGKGIRLIVRGFAGYPESLDVDDVQPPAILYTKGNADLLLGRKICMVGTRRSTDYGKRVANEWGAELACKFTIVSGHATGIDTYAVRSCLAAGGSAIIVLACGIDKFALPDFMAKCPQDRLLLVSEYPLGTRVTKFAYHERNRLLSGLSEAVIVVEAGESSGAIMTADYAAHQNRTVFAVPGGVFSDRSRGTNNLIRSGAIAATSVSDIFEDLGVGYDNGKREELPDMTDEEKKVYKFLSEGRRHFDEITEMLGSAPFEVSSLLSLMELEGIIEKQMQNYFALLK